MSPQARTSFIAVGIVGGLIVVAGGLLAVLFVVTKDKGTVPETKLVDEPPPGPANSQFAVQGKRLTMIAKVIAFPTSTDEIFALWPTGKEKPKAVALHEKLVVVLWRSGEGDSFKVTCSFDVQPGQKSPAELLSVNQVATIEGTVLVRDRNLIWVTGCRIID